jgi:hypothetical protein
MKIRPTCKVQAIADYTITFKGKVLMQQQIPGTVGALDAAELFTTELIS